MVGDFGRRRQSRVRTHWATDPVHAKLHSYYKLASNLMDLHKNFRDGKGEEVSSTKRPRNNSSTADGYEDRYGNRRCN
jgi:hypothetical protein